VLAVRTTDGDVRDTAPRWLTHGRLSEVIVIDGLPIGDLPAGARLRLGPSVVVELGPPAPANDGFGGLLEAATEAFLPAQVLDPGEVTHGDEVALEAVAVPVSEVLDLHSFRPEETQQVVAEYLAEARRAGFDEVRIVHGRGRGVQRALVRRVLCVAPEVAEFADAPPARGGWGATLVRLRAPGDSRTT
jgi:hypothetical protein